MEWRTKLITAPATEPVTPADLRLFGRIPSDVSDATLTPLIKSAREAAEDYQNRAYITQAWELIGDTIPTCDIDLPLPPAIALTSVTITDTTGTATTVPTTDFTLDTSGGKARLSLKYGKNYPAVTPEKAGVAIRWTCGYGAASAVPERIKTAIILGALWYYDHPAEPMTEAFFKELDANRLTPV
jgi:uncharacterized phiE125 gp8 family phage protein